MALKLYKDQACTDLIDNSGNPDQVKKATLEGTDLVAEDVIYIKSDDDTLTYEGVTITGQGDDDFTTTFGEVDILYAPDNDGSPGEYVQELSLPDGDYATAVPIWRKAYAPEVDSAFQRSDIRHKLRALEYLK